MFDQLIVICPECHKDFPLSESLTQSLIGDAVEQRLEAERAALTRQAQQKAEAALGTRLAVAEESLADKDMKLKDAQSKELAVLRQQKRLEEDKRELELQ